MSNKAKEVEKHLMVTLVQELQKGGNLHDLITVRGSWNSN